MSKQIVIIVLSIIMFISVWVIVIIQFSTQQELEPLIVTAVEGESENGRTIPLPETIEHDQNEKELSTKDGESLILEDLPVSIEGTLKEEQPSTDETDHNNESSELLDLRFYDFSDISTPDGIPIEEILTKLNLN